MTGRASGPGDVHAVPGTAPLGIILGSGLWGASDAQALGIEGEEQDVSTSRGSVRLRSADRFVLLQRHGIDAYHPPHEIPHHAHVLALEALGVTDVVGLTSVGALRASIVPGTVIVPEDYLSTHPPPTFSEANEALHIVPELDAGLRRFLESVASTVLQGGSAPSRPELLCGGVYAETRGPRFETRAEVRALARDAQVVGMTAASEATLCQERGIRYAMLGVVDNWAHGVTGEPLSLERFRERQAENRALSSSLLDGILRAVAVGARPFPDAGASDLLNPSEIEP